MDALALIKRMVWLHPVTGVSPVLGFALKAYTGADISSASMDDTGRVTVRTYDGQQDRFTSRFPKAYSYAEKGYDGVVIDLGVMLDG